MVRTVGQQWCSRGRNAHSPQIATYSLSHPTSAPSITYTTNCKCSTVILLLLWLHLCSLHNLYLAVLTENYLQCTKLCNKISMSHFDQLQAYNQCGSQLLLLQFSQYWSAVPVISVAGNANHGAQFCTISHKACAISFLTFAHHCKILYDYFDLESNQPEISITECMQP